VIGQAGHCGPALACGPIERALQAVASVDGELKPGQTVVEASSGIGVAPLKGLTLFSLLFFLWYGPLFFVVFFYNSCVIPVFRAVFGESSKNQVHSIPRSLPSTGYLRRPICGSLSDRHMPGETLHLPCRSGSSSLRASCSGSSRCFGSCLSAFSRCSSRTSACPRCVRRSRGSSRRSSRWSKTAASRCWHRLP
jgi:hypothetical protein